MDKEILGIIGTFGGVVLGFSLSQAAEWYRSRRIKKISRKSVRHLLLLEIRKNYRLLGIYWDEVKLLTSKKSNEDEETSLISYAYSISETPFPLLSRSGWESHLGKATEAFSIEEITHVWDFYEDLSQLSKLHEGITYLRDAAHTRSNAAVPGPFAHGIAAAMEFHGSSEGPAKQFKMIIEGVLEFRGFERIMTV